jgi:hypothetical protein
VIGTTPQANPIKSGREHTEPDHHRSGFQPPPERHNHPDTEGASGLNHG